MKRMYIKFMTAKERMRKALADNSGQGALETAVGVLIAVVLGALILAGLYALIGDQVLPSLREKIQDMFDYSG